MKKEKSKNKITKRGRQKRKRKPTNDHPGRQTNKYLPDCRD